MIAQGDGVVDDAGEVGVHRGFSVSSKGDDVGASAFLLHRLQFLLENFGNFFASGDAQFGLGVTIETAFAINAIEGAEFSIGRQEINAKRNSQSSTMHRAENRGWKEYSGHI